MTHQQRVLLNGFFDDVQAKLGEIEDGMPLGYLYAGLMHKVSYDGFQKLIAILCATGRCYTKGEKIYANPIATQV